jgi:hypothetical protein
MAEIYLEKCHKISLLILHKFFNIKEIPKLKKEDHLLTGKIMKLLIKNLKKRKWALWNL